MPEIAINVPFEASEVKEIIVQELRKRLDGLSPLSHSKEYAAFSASFQITIRLRRVGETVVDEKETLAWGNVNGGEITAEQEAAGEVEGLATVDRFESRDPNVERQARDMPLTVEGSDGKGGKARRKVRVSQKDTVKSA